MSQSHSSPQARHLHTPSAATPFHFLLKSSQVFLVLFEWHTQIRSTMRFALHKLEDSRVSFCLWSHCGLLSMVQVKQCCVIISITNYSSSYSLNQSNVYILLTSLSCWGIIARHHSQGTGVNPHVDTCCSRSLRLTLSLQAAFGHVTSEYLQLSRWSYLGR